MIQARDLIVACTGCGAENFYDVDARAPCASCWSCNHQFDWPPRIEIHRGGRDVHTLMLDAGSQLYPHHVDKRRTYDFSLPVAVAEVHRPEGAGLVNTSEESWVARDARGTLKSIAKGSCVRLEGGTKIHFGTTEGHVVV